MVGLCDVGRQGVGALDDGALVEDRLPGSSFPPVQRALAGDASLSVQGVAHLGQRVGELDDLRVLDAVPADERDRMSALQPSENDPLDVFALVLGARGADLPEVGGDLDLERFVVPDELGMIEDGLSSQEVSMPLRRRSPVPELAVT